MNKTFLILLLQLIGLSVYAGTPEIKKVAPQNWWAGMEETQLQILLYGDNLTDYTPTLKGDKVELQEVVRVPNPNYLLLYVNIAEAPAQKFELQFSKDGATISIPYELCERRESAREVKGFDSSDVLYLVMPDRFANGDPSNDAFKGFQEPSVDRCHPFARHGGDLSGIRKHLDYLSELGVTALWLNPIQENEMPFGSYHGYAITDYYQIDRRLGSNEEFRALVRECHYRGIKVVMDMIFNHCGTHNYLFKDMPSREWFNFRGSFSPSSFRTSTQMDPYATQGDLRHAVDGWFVESMPDFNQRNPHVLKYLIQSSIYWIEYAGINGIRQDTHPFADWDAMSEWVKAVEREYPYFNIVGETWFTHNTQIAYWQKDSKLAAPRNSQLRSVMDFPLHFLMQATFGNEEDSQQGFNQIYEYLGQDYVYEDPQNLMIFLDNHDTSRLFKHDSLVSLDKYKQAITFLLTTRGIPQLYYGTEILMVADKANGDGLLRQDFPGGWAEDSRSVFTKEGRTEMENKAFDFAKKLLHWRKGSKAVALGTLRHQDPRNGIYSYTRTYDDEEVVVIFNTTDKTQATSPDRIRELTNATVKYDLISEQMINLDKQIAITPYGTLLLVDR